MKELSIEEKAQRYDEAIERAKALYDNNQPISGSNVIIDNIFPQLKESKESKDEMIRRVIRGWIYTQPASFFDNGISKEEILAWLEKQGEQKETLCDKCKKAQPSHSCQDITALGRCALEKQGEQKPAWNEEDENLFRCAIDAVEQESKVRADGCLDEEVGEMVINWLKSLKERYTWKPSKEQIMALRWVLNHIPYDSHKEELHGLLEQLKQL